ncbi:MAG TPA: rhomboid family intramembrane serine protease [Candidatus Stackebrandtia faecavium]|nr:rhomboid family intramembrane serine protease [Candidatus Stackebrandtia faecavium]
MSRPIQDPTSTRSRARSSPLLQSGAIMVGFVALLWCVEVVDVILPADLDQYGVVSRDVDGLGGIVAAPLLHSGFSHLAGNSIPLLVLGVICAIRGLRRFIAASLLIVAISGLGVWLVGPSNTVTVGASGLIFGYFALAIGRGIFDRRALDIVLAVIVVVVYGSIMWGVLPSDPSVSWQGHLFGFIGGLVSAWFFRRKSLTYRASNGY